MGGLTLGFMGNAEQCTVSNPTYVNATAVSVTVQNTGSATVTITSATIDGNAAVISSAGSQTAPWTILKGTSDSLIITFSGTVLHFTSTAQYQISLTTAKGNTETVSYTYTGSPSA
jgi:hypothetical protein